MSKDTSLWHWLESAGKLFGFFFFGFGVVVVVFLGFFIEFVGIAFFLNAFRVLVCFLTLVCLLSIIRESVRFDACIYLYARVQHT